MRANAMAGFESRLRFLQSRDAAEAELNPERNPFAEAGDALVTTGLRAGLPLAAAVLSAETGPGMVPITAGAGAIGNRLANIYEDARGYEKPQKSFLGNLKEDLDWGAMAGIGAAIPALPRLPARFIARSPLKAAVTQGLADTAAGAITNTGMDAALQLSQTGELDSQRLAEMGLMGGGMSALIGLHPAMDTLRRGRAAGRARPVNQMPDVPPVEPTLALGRGPQLPLQDGAGNIVPDGPPPVPQLPPPKSTSKTSKISKTSKTIKDVTERMATASDPEQKLAILKQEVKLRGDTLTMIEQRVALDAKISLESQIAKKNAAQEKVDTAVEAQEAQVAAVEKQQKQQEDLLKAQQKVEMEQVKAAEAANKQQQDAVAEQQRVADEAEKATKLLEPKPIVLANAAATAAKAIENQPGTGQGVLNEISSAPAQQAPDPQQMMPPSNAAPLPQQLQQPSSGIALPTISRPTKAQLKAIPEDTQFLYKEGKNSYYQVDRTPEDPRGRTVDKQTLKAEGYDVSKLPKPPKNGVDDNFDERSLISGMADKEIEGQVAPAPAATQQAQPEATPDYGPPPPDNTENRRKGAFRRQQRGSVSEDALSSLAGTGLGGAYGFISTEKREDESEEQFQARRLKNMLAWAAGGAAAGFGTSRALTPGKRAIRRDGGPQPSSRVARSLGMVVDHKPIMQRISDTALLAEKWKNIALRGSPMRKPFYDATQRAQYRIMAGLAETVSILNNMRRIVVTQHSGPQKQAVFDKINEVFLDISKLEQLPANLQKDAARMFGIRAHNATLLNNMEGLTQATRDTIAENGGNYLARQYAIFDLKNERELRAYKESLAPEDVSAALDAIQESWKPKPKSPEEQKFAADTIEFVAKQAVGGSDDAVASIKSLRPWMTDADAARVAAWVAGGKQPGLPKVRALYQELINPSDVTRDEAKVLLDQFLDRNQFGPFSIGRKEIGGKDVTSLYQKQEIDTRLRKVLGEVKDPLKNAYRTVDNQVQLIERDRQQRELIGIGSGMNIMTKDADVAASKGFQPFVKAGTQLNGSYDNWDGVYIDPVFREEFQGLFNQSGMDDNLAKKLILDPIRTATGVFKWMKIIPSTDSRSINALGAYLNNVQNGRALNPLGKGYREGTKALLTQAGLINPTGGPNGKAINDLIKVMTEQGIMDESAIGRDFQENIKNGTLDGALGKIDAFIQNGISNPTARKAAMLARFEVSGGEFAAADTVARIAGFLSERADYRKAYPDLSDGAIDDLAGRAMRMTGMIYSEVPHILRKLSGYSVLPAFINFPYATARAAINGARLGAAEVKEGRETGNNALLRKGARRLASLALVTAAASGGGVSHWVNKSNGITDKQEDAARRIGPSYIQNSAIMFGGPIENGRVSIVEQSYLLPNAMLTTPFSEGIKAAKDGGFWKGLERTAEVALEPFLGGSNENVMSLGPVAGTIEQIRGNKNEFGERIFNPEDPEKNKVISKYILNKFAPGGWSKAQRMSKALSDNPVGTSGQVYSMKEEALRTLGRRSTTIDARVILPRRSADIYSRYTNAGKLYTETVRKNPSFTPEEKAAAYKKMTDAQAEVFSDLVQLYDDGKTFGLGDSEIRRGMDMAGVPNALINQVRATKYRPNRQIQLDHKLEQRLRLQDRFRAGGAGNIVTDGPPPGPQLPPPKKSEFVPYK